MTYRIVAAHNFRSDGACTAIRKEDDKGKRGEDLWGLQYAVLQETVLQRYEELPLVGGERDTRDGDAWHVRDHLLPAPLGRQVDDVKRGRVGEHQHVVPARREAQGVAGLVRCGPSPEAHLRREQSASFRYTSLLFRLIRFQFPPPPLNDFLLPLHLEFYYRKKQVPPPQRRPTRGRSAYSRNSPRRATRTGSSRSTDLPRTE